MHWINGETISLALFCVGMYGLIARRNMIKSIISLGILEMAVILYFITLWAAPGQLPPIGDVPVQDMADPLPQALMITAIVIGICVTAVNLTLFISLYHKYGTTNWDKARAMQKRERRAQDEVHT